MWYALVCTQVIHGVYGSALKDMAEAEAKRRSIETGWTWYVVPRSYKPSVGEYIG